MVIDMIGQVFGGWLVLRRAGSDSRGEATWECSCECGSLRIIVSSSLRSGNSRSCGCRKIKFPNNRTHGHSKSKMYGVWKSMKSRCHDPSTEAYKDYGARGIRVCREWRNSFERFLKDMGIRPTELHSIDRKDNDKGYSPDNCRWVTKDVQANNMRSNRRIEINGAEMTMTQWANLVGINPQTLWKRLNSGWSKESAIMTPVRR